MKEYDDFFEALDDAIARAGNMSRLSRLSGVPVQSIQRWKVRERGPSLEAIIPLLPFIDWPKRSTSKPLTIHNMGSAAPVEKVTGDDLPVVPVMGCAGAGNPHEDMWDMEPERYIPVLPKYYTSTTRAIEIKGNSMEPTIKDGSIVGIRPMDGPLQEGAIYVVRIPAFGMVCKRVKANGMSGITLISDNPAYDPVEVSIADCEGVFVGKVAWCLQEM